MFDSKIISAEPLSASLEDRIQPLRTMIATIGGHLDRPVGGAAAQDGVMPDFATLASRYALAGSVARRRVDALLHETGVESLAGGGLIAQRGDCSTPGTIAAARFLHHRIEAAFRQIDRLLPLAA